MTVVSVVSVDFTVLFCHISRDVTETYVGLFAVSAEPDSFIIGDKYDWKSCSLHQ